MRCCFSDGRPYSVRMLWSRSASLMRTTRMSSAIARNILRMFSACCCSWLWVLNFDSLVTPSTSWATSAPNRSSTSVRLYSVSSGTSWSSAAWIATGSIPSSARIWAEAIGCVTYGSPVARRWPAWASTARSNAALTGSRSASGWCSRIAAPQGRRAAPRGRGPRRRGRARGDRSVRGSRRTRRDGPASLAAPVLALPWRFRAWRGRGRHGRQG